MDLVRTTDLGPVRTVTMCAAERRNALSMGMQAQLMSAIATAARDDSVKAMVLLGEGLHFCAGGDIDVLSRRTPPNSAWDPTRLDVAIETCGKPVVSGVHGATLGGGLELALASTMRVAADDLRAGFPELRLGIFPALGGTQRLARMVGESLAIDLILTGRTLTATEAHALGLVATVVEADQLRDTAVGVARRLADLPPIAVRAAVDAVRAAQGMARSDGLAYERSLFGVTCGTEDKSEGVSAWREKRTPAFKGR